VFVVLMISCKASSWCDGWVGVFCDCCIDDQLQGELVMWWVGGCVMCLLYWWSAARRAREQLKDVSLKLLNVIGDLQLVSLIVIEVCIDQLLPLAFHVVV